MLIHDVAVRKTKWLILDDIKWWAFVIAVSKHSAAASHCNHSWASFVGWSDKNSCQRLMWILSVTWWMKCPWWLVRKQKNVDAFDAKTAQKELVFDPKLTNPKDD